MSSAALYCDRKLPCRVVVGFLRPPLTAAEMTWLGVQLPSSTLAEGPAPTKLASTAIYNQPSPAGRLSTGEPKGSNYMPNCGFLRSGDRGRFLWHEAEVGLPVQTAARVAYVVCLFFIRGRVFDPPKICINAHD